MGHDKTPQREAPTFGELLEFAARLPPDEAEALLARARPAPQVPEPEAPGRPRHRRSTRRGRTSWPGRHPQGGWHGAGRRPRWPTGRA